MLQKIFQQRPALARQLAAPLRTAREEFLAHLAQRGWSRLKLQIAAHCIIHFIEQTNLRRMRRVCLSDVRHAAEEWRTRNPKRPASDCTRRRFLSHAKAWLKFQNKLIEPPKWNHPRDHRVAAYAKYLCVEVGFAKRTIDNRIRDLNCFLKWLDENNLLLNQVTTAEVEKYLDSRTAIGLLGSTVAIDAHNLKVFFRFAERRRWCGKGISSGIFGPVVERRSEIRRGPSWKDVLRFIDSFSGTGPNDLRSRAVLLLLSMYALRASEVCNLNLADVNFKEDILTVRRSKNRLIQRFPLIPEVHSALHKYVMQGRPASQSPRFFLTLTPPHVPICQSSLYMVTKKMRRLGIVSVTYGPHSLRHACATHLLVSGTPVGQVASLLGHASTRYIGDYTKHTVDELRVVSNFELNGLYVAL